MLFRYNIITADLRLSKIENFLVDESVLSGESVPIAKINQPLLKEAKEIFEAENIVFAGTAVVSGEAEGIVINTAKNTVFGEIVKLTSEITKKSVCEKDLLKFSRIILRIALTTIVFIFLANLIIKGTANFFDFLIFSIALIVSIIPEALPLVVTFALSQGALRMAKEKVIIKRLSSIEDLGNVEILCTDKTGTLTEGKLELEDVYSLDKERCLLYALLSSSFMKEEIESSLTPFDLAIFKKTPKTIQKSLTNFKEITEIPFDPLRLRTSSLLEKDGRKILIVKGAPEIILKLSSKFEGDLNNRELRNSVFPRSSASSSAFFRGASRGSTRIATRIDADNSHFVIERY